MYIPKAFAETSLPKLHDHIERNSFGMLASQLDGSPFVTHLPLLLDRSAGPQGCLLGHMARSNPQWRQAGGQSVLAIFPGPHAYVSPTWYEAEDVVPTWNYVAVHVYGTLKLIEDTQYLLEVVGRTVREYEQHMPRPWALEGSTYVERLLALIVGFRIPIERIEGKWKLNQNQPAERREKVIRALRERGGENALEIAALMEERESEKSGNEYGESKT
jgi:transcriptional regulator